MSSKNTKRFIFSPANDFSYLLAEIDRLSDSNSYLNASFMGDGIYELPWEFVKFYDGIMYLIHPNPSKRGTYTPYQYRNYSILKSFIDIMPYIENNCPKFQVICKDGVIVDVLNFNEFASKIVQFREYAEITEREAIDLNSSIAGNAFKAYTVDAFRKLTIVNKSPYLQFLSSKQNLNHKIEYILELKNHTASISESEEYGYLFYVGEKTIVFENITDLSRSTLIFYINSHST